MKYLARLQHPVKTYVEHVLATYHRTLVELKTARLDYVPSSTTSMSPTAGIHGGTEGRPVESAVLRADADPYIRDLERRVQAIEKTLAGADEIDRRIVSAVYWTGTKTISGAACDCGISPSAAYARMNRVLVELAINLGLIRRAA